VAFLIAIIPFVLLSLAHWHLAPLLVRGDYAQYVLHARAILEGRPYGDTGYLYSQLAPFVGPPLQPPGLPLTLVPVVWAFGINDTAFRLVMVLSGIAFLVLATIGRRERRGGCVQDAPQRSPASRSSAPTPRTFRCRTSDSAPSFGP